MGNKHSTVVGSVYQAAASGPTSDDGVTAASQRNDSLMRRCESHQSVFSEENFQLHNGADELLVLESLSVKSGASSPTRTPRRMHPSAESCRFPAAASPPAHFKGNVVVAPLPSAPKATSLVPEHSMLVEAPNSVKAPTTNDDRAARHLVGAGYHNSMLHDLEEFDLT